MRRWWSGLSERDRRILSVGAVVAITLLLWASAWLPLVRARASLRAQAVAQAQALTWMRPAVTAARALGGAVAPTARDERSLLARVDADLRAAGLGPALVNVEPQGEHAVRAQFAAVPFDMLGDWLQASSGAGLHIVELSLNRSGEGRVDARVLLGEDGR